MPSHMWLSCGDETGTDWDDIWLVRYVLSFPDPQARTEAVRKAIAYRRERAVLLAGALAGQPAPHHDQLQKLNIAGFHATTKLGEPVYIVRTNVSDPTAVMESLTPEQVLENLLHEREVAFRMCDAETRKRRVLVKMITIIALEGVALANIDRRFFKQLGEGGKIAEFVYVRNIVVRIFLDGVGYPRSVTYIMHILSS